MHRRLLTAAATEVFDIGMVLLGQPSAFPAKSVFPAFARSFARGSITTWPLESSMVVCIWLGEKGSPLCDQITATTQPDITATKMSQAKLPEGVFPTMITPFLLDGSIDWGTLDGSSISYA